jgi:hypothetical protein
MLGQSDSGQKNCWKAWAGRYVAGYEDRYALESANGTGDGTNSFYTIANLIEKTVTVNFKHLYDIGVKL